MRVPHKTTISALLKRKGPWRILAKELGISNYGLLNDIARGREGKVSIEAENQVREKLGLKLLTKSGNHVYKPRQLVRPIVSHEQNHRRTKLNVSWREVIEVGLEELETLEEYERRTTDGRGAQASGEEQAEGGGL